MTQLEFNIWWEEAQEYFPDDDSMKEGYMFCLREIAERFNLKVPE
jgi:hypothetical protein